MNEKDDFIPEEWQDDSLYVGSMDDVIIEPEPGYDVEGVTDGTKSTDIVPVSDTTDTELDTIGNETTETIETEPAFINEWKPVKKYHFDEDGNFVVDEEW